MFGRVMMDFVASRGWKTIAVFYAGDALGSQSKLQVSYYSQVILRGKICYRNANASTL